ncbi:hypothetical protein [Dyadobacter sp. CY323]|uniref:hypothetical protein n=1 Tax=Dyadobacter sp. CY323 TaxID=2907302 RepID=UPI001F198E17|nr:hypothetical protein [Dyadobacter sp. CY323]MCE6987630.1 hypothetical protein [Dyadobacter sp. CY323]
MSRIIMNTFALIFLALLGYSCTQSAGDPKEAAGLLTAASKWQIDEIVVNDAVTFKDGKMTQQFGGVNFERYMETVELRSDGTFSGIFKGETKPFVLKWVANEKNITVGSADSGPKPTDWTIDPKDVLKDSFTMKTKSTAYDYPRMTSIALRFKVLK